MEEREALEKQALLWIAREEVGEAEHRDGRARLRHLARADGHAPCEAVGQ